MQFAINREAILKPLLRVAGAVEKRHAMPILTNFLVTVKSQLLTFMGADQEIEVIARIPLTEPAEPGEATVPGKKLIDICKALSDDVLIQFQCADDKTIVKAGRSRFTLSAMPAKNFPRIEEGVGETELSVSQGDLRKLIDATSFAMANQDVRYYLNGIHCIFAKDFMRMVAADGHRLATLAIPANFPHLDSPVSIILPRKAVLEMQRLFGEDNEEVGLVIGKNHLRAITTQNSFNSKLIEGKFPDYKMVLPSESGFSATLSKDEFKQALQRVCALFSDKYRGVSLRFQPGILHIIAVNTDKDEVEDELEIEYSGKELEIGLNASYLIEYLNIISEPFVVMTFTDPNGSILLQPSVSNNIESNKNSNSIDESGHNYVVMPMRL